MSAIDYSTWTLPDLKAQLIVLGDQLSTIDDSRREIVKEIRKRERKAVAMARIKDMSADELAALKEVLLS